MVQVGAWVLLKRSLYCGNNRCRYLGDFLEVSFVSWSVSIEGLVLSINECNHGSEVLRDEIFQVVKWVARVEYSTL
jgi:hypothetical protein